MMRSLNSKVWQMGVLIVFLVGSTVTGATSTFEHETFTASVSMGWDVLDQNEKYVFEGSPRPFHDPFDFIDEQDDIVKRVGVKAFTHDDMIAYFGDDFTPVLLAISTTEDFGDEEPVMVSISSPSVLLEGKLLAGWERQYGVRPKSRGGYYFLNRIAPASAYEIIFLLPKDIARSPIRINLRASLGGWTSSDFAVTADSDHLEGIKERIRFLELEVQRLQAFVE